jgi:uncharacterized membrane protein YkgB
LQRSALLAKDRDYQIVRASMVIIFLFFGYQKWWAYEAERLIPFISNGPLIWWLYPAFGIRGASWFLGTFERIFGALLFAGFWDKRLDRLGAVGSAATFIATVTIIPFVPGGWVASAGGFPAMTGNVPFLMKDVVLPAASLYFLRQDALRVRSNAPATGPPRKPPLKGRVRSYNPRKAAETNGLPRAEDRARRGSAGGRGGVDSRCRLIAQSIRIQAGRLQFHGSNAPVVLGLDLSGVVVAAGEDV